MYDGVRFGGAADDLVEAEFLLSLTNTGQLDGIDIPVSVGVEGEAARASDSIAMLGAGESTSLVVAHALPPGDHDIVFQVGESDLRETVSIPAADIALTVEGYAVAGNRLMTIDARVENSGGLDAENIILSAQWRPLPGADGSPGKAEAAATLDRVAAGGGSATASFTLPIPTGAYTLTLTASTASPESATDNNAVRRYLEAEYADLTIEVAGEQVTGYETDGDGLVDLALRVTNAGVGPTGPLAVGAVCAEDAPAPCETAGAVDSLAPSESAEAVVTLALPQGKNALTVYAGANEAAYRWGERNAVAHAVTVPEKSAVALELTAPLEVSGYWSDGTARVALAITVANGGYSPMTDALAVSVACYRDGAPPDAPEADCGGITEVALPDGFGPAITTAAYRVPMGTTLRASLPGEAQEAEGVVVPERILGVKRDHWDCYSDRPDWKPTRANDFLGGCAGFEGSTVEKWEPGLAVRAWADPAGEQRYIDIFWESLDDLAPLLGLQVERAADEADANFKAYVGVPASRNVSVGFADYCQEAAGCGGPDAISRGAITAGSLSVWLNPEDDSMRIKNVTLHEILHAVTGVHHASNSSSIMSYANWDRPSLGVEDTAFYRIHGHSLVEPGMTLAEVEEFIVFADELLDPPAEAEPDGLAIADRAHKALIEAGSARFHIHGGWGGGYGCADNAFNGRLAIGDLSGGYAGLLNFDRGYDTLAVAYSSDRGWRYWRGSGGAWTLTTRSSLFDGTNWRSGFTNPADMLISVLRYADADDVSVRSRFGDIELALTLANHRILPLNWARGATIDVNITLDAETYAMTGYRMAWDFDVISSSSCNHYQVTATGGEYDVDVPDPR